MVGALGSETGFASSMLNVVISMMHVLLYHKNSKLQLSGLKKKQTKNNIELAVIISSVSKAVKN